MYRASISLQRSLRISRLGTPSPFVTRTKRRLLPRGPDEFPAGPQLVK
jgi:hypothetical protein